MIPDWYAPFPTTVDRPLKEIPRRAARREFELRMQLKEERKAVLGRLLDELGEKLDSSDEGIRRLERWFRASVRGSDREPDRLASEWYCVALDMGLFVGDAMIERFPQLEWRMYVDTRRDVSYQRPVIAGFQRLVDDIDHRYHVDPELLIATDGHRVITGLPVDDDALLAVVSCEYLLSSDRS